MSESLPVMAQKGSYKVEVEAGKSYWWCSCGKSGKQPFCDGSHKGSSFSPMKFEAETSGVVSFCGCKITGKAPRCDGSHKNIPYPDWWPPARAATFSMRRNRPGVSQPAGAPAGSCGHAAPRGGCALSAPSTGTG